MTLEQCGRSKVGGRMLHHVGTIKWSNIGGTTTKHITITKGKKKTKKNTYCHGHEAKPNSKKLRGWVVQPPLSQEVVGSTMASDPTTPPACAKGYGPWQRMGENRLLVIDETVEVQDLKKTTNYFRDILGKCEHITCWIWKYHDINWLYPKISPNIITWMSDLLALHFWCTLRT